MKNVKAILLITAAAALLLSSCNRDKKRTIAVIPKGNAHLFWQSVHAGAIAAAREEGVELLWNGPTSEADYSMQLQIVDAMINRRVDAIALAPIDKKVMVNVVERAAKEKIPMMIFDSGIDTQQFTSQIATDNYHAGELAAERIGQILNGKGKVGIVAVQPGAASTMAREAGFEEYVKKNLPGIQIVDKQYGMADFAISLTKAENMLTAYSDLDALFASNESSAVGAAQALRGRKGSKVKLVGFDSSPTLIDDLKIGLVDSLVTQDPFQMGYQSVKTAVAAISGKPVEKIHNLEPKLVTRENLQTPEVQNRLNPDIKKYLN